MRPSLYCDVATWAGGSLLTFRGNLPIFKDQSVDYLTFEDGTDRLSRNVDNQLQT